MRKIVRVALASSVNLIEGARKEIFELFARINDTCVSRGLFFELVSFDESAEDSEARTCDQFYLIVGKQLDGKSEEQLNHAWEEFQKEHLPRIYAWFQVAKEGKTAPEVEDLIARLRGDEINEYTNTFLNIDQVKTEMMLGLLEGSDSLYAFGSEANTESALAFKDGKMLVYGVEVATLENVPCYAGNKNLAKKRQELASLNEQYAEVAHMLEASDFSNPSVQAICNQLDNERSQLIEEISQMEGAVLAVMRTAATARHLGGGVENQRRRMAAACLDKGDYDSAIAILGDPVVDSAIKRAEVRVQIARQMESDGMSELTEYIKTKRAYAQICVARRGDGDLEAADAAFAEACRLAQDYSIAAEMDVLKDYVEFLRNREDYSKAIEIAQKYRSYAQTNCGEYEIACADYALGVLYVDSNLFEDAERYLKEALNGFKRLSDQDQDFDMYGPGYLESFFVLGQLYEQSKRSEEAIELYRKALVILEEHGMQEHQAAARCYDCLGNSFLIQGDLEEAKRSCYRAIEIRKKLANGDPRFLRDLAETYDNLMIVFWHEEQYMGVERTTELSKYMLLALEAWIDLAERNPKAHLQGMLESSDRLENLLVNAGQLSLSTWFRRVELDKCREITKKEPEVGRPAVAFFCTRLGESLVYEGTFFKEKADTCFEEAERLFHEAIDIVQEFVDCPADLPTLMAVSFAYPSLAKLLESSGRIEEAENIRHKQQLWIAANRRATE